MFVDIWQPSICLLQDQILFLLLFIFLSQAALKFECKTTDPSYWKQSRVFMPADYVQHLCKMSESISVESHLRGYHQKGQFKDNIIHKRYVVQWALYLKISLTFWKQKVNEVLNIAQSPDSPGEFYQGLKMDVFPFQRGEWDCPQKCVQHLRV